MINTLKIFDELKETIDVSAARKIAEIIGVVYEELKNTVTKVEFNELKEVIKELAEAQKASEKRLTRLEQVVEELAEAQKRTEVKIEELAEAQKRTEHVIEELVEAQKRTEAALEELIHEHGETRRQLGGLAMTVGYTLENESYKALPQLLKRDLNFVVKGRLKRQYVLDNKGQYIEVNIIGEAAKNGKKVTIVGEGKSQLSKHDVDDFIRKKLKRLEGVFGEVLPVLIVHMTSGPQVEEYVKEKGIVLYYSYDF